MQIKRDLTKLAKRMSPQIEVMNVADELRRCVKRIDELITYAQTKIDRSIERQKTKEKTLGQKADERRKAEEKVIFDHQTAESDENQRDQKEAFDERNKKPGMEDEEATSGSVPDPAGDDAVSGGDGADSGIKDDVNAG